MQVLLLWAVSIQHWRKQRLLAALGRALLKLLSRHKLLVSDQALYLQCKFPLSSLVLSCCYNVVYSFPDLNLKQQFQVVNSILFHFILEKGKRHTNYHLQSTYLSVVGIPKSTQISSTLIL